MKKKWIIIGSVIILLVVLFLPVPQTSLDDGGTREYTALTYKIVHWNRIFDDGVYEKTRFYIGSDAYKSVEELWLAESENLVQSFTATVIEVGEAWVLVEPVEGEPERRSADRISFGTAELSALTPKPGDYVKVYYKGGIMESYPAQIHATGWETAKDLRSVTFQTQWMDKMTAEAYEMAPFGDVFITSIYENCFFATPVIPMPYTIKFNGQLPADWCVGDQVKCDCENVYYDQENDRMEADLLSVQQGTFVPDPFMCYKPVIYLYPEQTTQVSVNLTLGGKLTCTYPAYNDGWHVTAQPDGLLTDENGQTYNYLYWEGETPVPYDLSKGFCIRGNETAAFLEDALEKLGLSRREANEFIVYWLPLMQDNPYNVITFQKDAYEAAAKLDITPAPDTLIRVFMAWYPSDVAVDIEPQELTAPERTGFTAIEWGGTELS